MLIFACSPTVGEVAQIRTVGGHLQQGLTVSPGLILRVAKVNFNPRCFKLSASELLLIRGLHECNFDVGELGGTVL